MKRQNIKDFLHGIGNVLELIPSKYSRDQFLVYMNTNPSDALTSDCDKVMGDLELAIDKLTKEEPENTLLIKKTGENLKGFLAYFKSSFHYRD